MMGLTRYYKTAVFTFISQVIVFGRGAFINSLVRGEPLNSLLRNLASKL